MKPEKRKLIDDLLESDVQRGAVLAAGGRVLRRRRQQRAISFGAALLLPVMIAVWCLPWPARTPVRRETSKPVTPPAAPAPAEALTDDQLLALFPNTPVALARLADGRKRLLFPHPGDEQKFVTKL